MRITGIHMDGLMDGLSQGQQTPQTSLQNAILVRIAFLLQHGDATSMQDWSHPFASTWTEYLLKGLALLANSAPVHVSLHNPQPEGDGPAAWRLALQV